MNAYNPDLLKNFQRTKAFFIGIDSDGCVFDTMEIKQKECFCPAFINHFGLQAVAKYARETWEFVNLYSNSRGINRFKALTKALDLLRERDEVVSRKVTVPELKAVKEWTARESRLGEPALKAAIANNSHPDLVRTLEWSLDVNEAIRKIVRDVPPFPYVRDSLILAKDKADLIVVSQTPTPALEREWAEHRITGLVRLIAGQELGTKAEHLELAAGDRYDVNHVLMIGDAPGDYEAAQASGALFYPIIPGAEEDSWKAFYNEALSRFMDNTYAGTYEQELIEAFAASLPAHPAWKVSKKTA